MNRMADTTNDCEKIISDRLGEGFYNLKFDGETRLANRYKLHGALRLLEALVPAMKAAGVIRDDFELPSLICPVCVRQYFLEGGNPSHRCLLTENTHPLPPDAAPRNCPKLLLPKNRPLTEAIGHCGNPEKSTSECCARNSDRP